MSPEIYVLLNIRRPPRLSVKLLDGESFDDIQGLPAESLKKANIKIKQGKADRFERAAELATCFIDESKQKGITKLMTQGLRERRRVSYTFRTDIGNKGQKTYTLESTNQEKQNA